MALRIEAGSEPIPGFRLIQCVARSAAGDQVWKCKDRTTSFTQSISSPSPTRLNSFSGYPINWSRSSPFVFLTCS